MVINIISDTFLGIIFNLGFKKILQIFIFSLFYFAISDKISNNKIIKIFVVIILTFIGLLQR
jgi:hypothetical protein